jgi:hypothetical protein
MDAVEAPRVRAQAHPSAVDPSRGQLAKADHAVLPPGDAGNQGIRIGVGDLCTPVGD